jgi:hypothetical protein
VSSDTLLPDALVRDLMAVGQVDVLVGIPTLDNAATIRHVVQAVNGAFARYFPRDRTVLLNSDGGSTDDTPAIVRDTAVDDAGTVTVSHQLRTMHRISAPYHGLPGKGNALRQILTVADLTQARAVAVLDADVTSVTPEWIVALVRPVLDQQFDYVAPLYARHPADGPLVSQIVRPLMRAAYGWRVQEPLAAEFGCSSAFFGHCLEQTIWDTDLSRYAIDLWLTGEALSRGFRSCQTPLGPRLQVTGPDRPGFPQVFQQVVGAAFDCLDLHADYWLGRTDSEPLPVVGRAQPDRGDAPAIDAARLTQSFCADLRNLQSVLESILAPDTLRRLNEVAAGDCDQLQFPDELWVATVYDFLMAHHRGVMRHEHIAQALVPLYLGRTGSFLRQYGAADPDDITAALEALCVQFERSKPGLVEGWNPSHPR